MRVCCALQPWRLHGHVGAGNAYLRVAPGGTKQGGHGRSWGSPSLPAWAISAVWGSGFRFGACWVMRSPSQLRRGCCFPIFFSGESLATYPTKAVHQAAQPPPPTRILTSRVPYFEPVQSQSLSFRSGVVVAQGWVFKRHSGKRLHRLRPKKSQPWQRPPHIRCEIG